MSTQPFATTIAVETANSHCFDFTTAIPFVPVAPPCPPAGGPWRLQALAVFAGFPAGPRPRPCLSMDLGGKGHPGRRCVGIRSPEGRLRARRGGRRVARPRGPEPGTVRGPGVALVGMCAARRERSGVWLRLGMA